MAVEGYNTLLEADNGGLGVYSAIAEVLKISGPGIEVTSIDITHLRSPAAWKEFMSGFQDAGEITFDLLFNNTDYAGLFAMLRITENWRLTLPDGSVWVCEGFITKIGNDVPLDDKVTAPVTVKLTGEPSFS